MRSKVTVQPVDHGDGVSGPPAELLRSKGNSPFRVRGVIAGRYTFTYGLPEKTEPPVILS